MDEHELASIVNAFIASQHLVCHQSTRMDQRCFAILCHLLRTIAGLMSMEVVDVEEMVAMFLHILAHDVKNREEAGFVECLVELVNADGWRSDNETFCLRYLNQLARMMVFKIPGCNIHASTIDNRIKLMKRMFHALAEMRDPMCSGFGWNDKKNASSQRKKSSTIGSRCSHPAAKGLLNKWFLHYDELSYVFGKDRATGGRVENFADVGSNDPVGYDAFAADKQRRYVHAWSCKTFRDVSSLFVVEASSSVDVFYSTLLELGCTADGFFMASQKGPLTMNHFSHACFNVNRASIFYSDVKCLGDHILIQIFIELFDRYEKSLDKHIEAGKPPT
uniref:DUF8040 domain-containing protein n=1 Tax=Cucumis melo TaxID=3656 RepID=A0A9I9EJ09_CUCME